MKIAIRKRRSSRGKTQLTEDQVQHLLIGFCIGSDFPFESEEHRRRLWRQHKDWLMTVKIHPDGLRERKPGDRMPAAWFDYER